MKFKTLLIIPPFTQLNTPYPATTVLKGFLKSRGYEVSQVDLGIDLANRIFSSLGLKELNFPEEYQDTIDSAMYFLQGNDTTLANRIASGTFLPEGTRFDNETDLDWVFGNLGIIDKAKHLVTLYLEDIADHIRETINPHFDLIRYAEQIAMTAPTFDTLYAELQNISFCAIEKWMLELLEKEIQQSKPQLIGFSIPFPGCLFSALRCAQYIKQQHPEIKIVFGGGYVNTELRSITDKRFFEYVDFMLLDDGEPALLQLICYLNNECSADELIRCFYLNNENKLVYSGNDEVNIPFSKTGMPDFSDLPLSRYFSMIELPNPMHKLWTDGLWNKMTVAHGCYWAKCAFCDTTLDYIKRYDAPQASLVVDRMEATMQQTHQSGFHFTDEALPPALLKAMAHEIIKRKLNVSFWGNIRFEKAYTPELCNLLAQAGCIAVSGGLETASDRLLGLMNKGVSIAQAARTFHNFTQSGIMVHAYLMYGFPTATLQETVDSLEIVRQMFEQGLIQSAFWHRYTMTIHSPSGKCPEQFGAKRVNIQPAPFANNGITFDDGQKYDLDSIGDGLYKATYNFMHEIGFDLPMHKWFSTKTPPVSIKRNLIQSFLKN